MVLAHNFQERDCNEDVNNATIVLRLCVTLIITLKWRRYTTKLCKGNLINTLRKWELHCVEKARQRVHIVIATIYLLKAKFDIFECMWKSLYGIVSFCFVQKLFGMKISWYNPCQKNVQNELFCKIAYFNEHDDCPCSENDY